MAGGTNMQYNFGDVWTSPNKGEKWSRLVDVAAFGPRHGHALLDDFEAGDSISHFED